VEAGFPRANCFALGRWNDGSSANGWKPNPKLRGDEQEPDMRRDASGASGHVTAKSSICGWGAFCKSGVYAAKVTSLTPGDLSGASEDRGWALGN
jgi:hypothetical protein